MDEIRNIGFGCVALTSQAFTKRALDLLSAAFEEGIRHFDTAPVYGNGYSEKILGKFIRGKRENVTVATKCGLRGPKRPAIPLSLALPMNAMKKRLLEKNTTITKAIRQPEPLVFRVLGEEYVKGCLAASLENLGTDYIDYYLLHEALPAFLTPEAFSFLFEQKKNGIIRHLGIAAAYVNLLSLRQDDLAGWDILQYENGINYPTELILSRFTDKTHFYHSALKSLQTLPTGKYSATEWAGILLSRGVKTNPAGKLLFSTTKMENIRKNLDAYARYSNLPLQELNNIINAIH